MTRLFVYGGIDVQEETYGNLWYFDLSNIIKLNIEKLKEEDNLISWKIVKIEGNFPSKISHHQTILIENYLYIIGGLIDYSNISNFIYRIDLLTMKSESIEFKARLNRINHLFLEIIILAFVTKIKFICLEDTSKGIQLTSYGHMIV